MLIDFFYTLRSAKLPVSVKEYLTLLEALQAGVVGPKSDDAWSLDDFYNLSRLTLVKDEKHYDKFDRAFGAYFKGVEMVADFTKEIPAEWLRKILENELTPEQKAAAFRRADGSSAGRPGDTSSVGSWAGSPGGSSVCRFATPRAASERSAWRASRAGRTRSPPATRSWTRCCGRRTRRAAESWRCRSHLQTASGDRARPGSASP